MIEKNYNYQINDEKIIERIISDGNVDINHMILPKGGALPVHNSNSNVYMIIVRGTLTISLDEQLPSKYQKGNILNIPFDIKMHVFNEDEEILEFFVVKSPSPQNYQ
ncbi:MAG TPA: hypothetical protein DCG34_08040 [Clostridiales bacterium]|jgi:quercetin dioxygenase-like cupin family protein|nr:hypothetical protein [Clostridiales bacterium]